MKAALRPGSFGLSIVVVGLGNIGSQVVPLLAGISGLTRVAFVDPDRYSVSNLNTQRLAAKDVGQLKVAAQRRVLRALAPHVAIDVYACPVEAVPLGRLRGWVILACVDSRSARQSINRIAFRLGMPWIDAGLDRSGSVRARVYAPNLGACLECDWGERDYELLEQRMPCNAVASAFGAIATAAPMELGAMAASLQLWGLRRLLSGEPEAEDELAHQQQFFDLNSGVGWIGRYAGKNPHCRFDHAPWTLTPLARGALEVTLGDVFALAGAESSSATLSIDGQMIVRRVRCPQCRTVKSVGGRITGRLNIAPCGRCGGVMTPAAMDATGSLSLKDASDWLERPLAAFGLADGDVISLYTDNNVAHYELGSTQREAL